MIHQGLRLATRRAMTVVNFGERNARLDNRSNT
jgi:hypothetical protein